MKIFVGITARDGLVHYDLCSALVEEQRLAYKNGDLLLPCAIAGVPYIDRARNAVVHQFLHSGADRMVWVDYDVSWKPGALVKLAKRPEEFVGGAYRLKQHVEAYPIGFWPDQDVTERNEHGALPCKFIPFGFTKVAKSVYDAFKLRTPGRSYVDHLIGPVHMYFRSMFLKTPEQEHGEKIEEDIGFCLEWQSMGGKVFVDPSFPLVHHFGMVPFQGHFGDFIDRKLAEANDRCADKTGPEADGQG